MSLTLLGVVLSGCIVTPESNQGRQLRGTIDVQWVNPSDELVPGSLVQWDTDVQSDGFDFILEKDGFSITVCHQVDEACLLPAELEAGASYSWWLRGQTPTGIYRSPGFEFSTPDLPWTVQTEPTWNGRLTSNAEIPLSVEESEDVEVFIAILSAQDSSAYSLCWGYPVCRTDQPLLPGSHYAVTIRAYGQDGLYVEQELGVYTSNHRPTEAGAVFPAPGFEVNHGTVELRWSPSHDPEGDEVTYRVEWTTAGSSEWSQQEVGTNVAHEIQTDAGSSVKWRVVATDEHGASTPSPLFVFFTRDAPEEAVPFLPMGDELFPPNNPITFQWEPRSAGLHSVVVRTLENGSWTEACKGDRACTAQLALRAGTEYEWKVITDAGFGGTSASPIETFRTIDPVVLIHGLFSSGAAWTTGAAYLEDQGYELLDFDPSTSETVVLSYSPKDKSQGIADLTKDEVRPKIKAALEANGYNENTSIILVGHSLGGLVARELQQYMEIQEMITIGTPHLGSIWASELVIEGGKLVITALLSMMKIPLAEGITNLAVDALIGPWNGVITDLAPSSPYLDRINTANLGSPYVSIAGTIDRVVGLNSATFGSAQTYVVSLSHGDLTGGLCQASLAACGVELAPIRIVDEVLNGRA